MVSMKTQISIIGDDGDSATDLVKPQANGKVGFAKLLTALEIPEADWNSTWLQITAVVINREASCASGS